MKSAVTLILFAFCTLIPFNSNSQTGSWTMLCSGTSLHLLGVSAVNSNTCYVCGNSGKILKTTDGGATWISQVSGTTESLYSICFTDADNGIAVGDNGTVRKTIDGGKRWTGVSVTTDQLRCVSFFDAHTGYITGGVSATYGSIFKTTDGGANWSALSVSSANGMYSVKFTSITDGYASDWTGAIFKTTNAGATWYLLSSGTTNPLFAIDFTSSNNGVAIGFNGTTRRTTTSGASWCGVISGTSDFMTGLKFYDPNNGFAVGGNVSANTGTILRTCDGGSTWSLFNPGSPRLFKVDFPNACTGYAVGLDGTILKYTSITTGVAEQNNNIVSVTTYPNPSSGSTTLDLSTIKFYGPVSFELFDLTGKLIRRSEDISTDKFIVEQKELITGEYIFKISDSKNSTGVGKIIFN